MPYGVLRKFNFSTQKQCKYGDMIIKSRAMFEIDKCDWWTIKDYVVITFDPSLGLFTAC